MTKVKTRFAPSPTGSLHIGGARTALFNWLFAQHTGGEYFVRIEDTDKERSTEENRQIIKRDLAWLGLEPTTPYVQQSKNIEAHKQAVQKLVQAGFAYESDGAIRFKIPAGATSWEDLVQGQITYQNTQLEDFVVQRSDGTPTYHLAVVADDAAMGITHVIRGDDHINNTPKQILLHQALGNHVPFFAHIPLIHGPDGKKMSKRHGAASAEDFRTQGILPTALINYLCRLGWSLGNEEIIPLPRVVEKFELTDVNKGAAVFDQKKLEWLNAHYLKEMAEPELLALLQNFLPQQATLNSQQKKWLEHGLPSLKPRAKTLVDLAAQSTIFTTPAPFNFGQTELDILQSPTSQKILADFYAKFAEPTCLWDAEKLHTLIEEYVQSSGLKFKEVGQPLRLAVTGGLNGPSLAEIMVVFGKEETLSRLNSATK